MWGLKCGGCRGGGVGWNCGWTNTSGLKMCGECVGPEVWQVQEMRVGRSAARHVRTATLTLNAAHSPEVYHLHAAHTTPGPVCIAVH